MFHTLHKHFKQIFLYILPALVVLILLGGVLIYTFFQISSLKKDISALSVEIATTNLELARNTNLLSKNVTDLTKQTEGLTSTLTTTQHTVDAVRTKVGGVEQTVGSISGTVGNLQKLAAIDPQLLKKYSKVYFLNENYVPAHLTQLSQDYVYSTTRKEQFLTESSPYLLSLINKAKADGVTLYVKSAYRSYAEQKSLKSSYSVTYGAGTANAFSADQGYSEHQLGTTLDFITPGLGGQLTGFDGTEAYQWLLTNGYHFGFVISYPKGNKYYIYEPWHWRYVGVKLATYLHDNNLNFYDLDQREIDTYLINLFD